MASFSPSSLQTGTSAGAIGQAGTILQVGGAASSAAGTYYAGQAQRSALQYQAFTAETNARLAERSAQSVMLQGEQQAHQIQLRTSQMEGAQRSGFAANGLDLGEGSPARVQASTEVMSAIDVDTAQANAVRSAWGYRAQATNYENQARFNTTTADNTSPLAAGATSLLGSAGAVASNWYREKKAGG
jgi:hypothetical protein